jgi:hypothetical protein
MNSLRFDDRVVIVTGAGGGLGRSYATRLAALGAQVVVNDLGCDTSGDGTDTSAARMVVEEIVAQGGSAVADTTDIAIPDAGEAIVQRAVDSFGRVDALVNNAGITVGGKFDEQDGESFDRVLDINLHGAIRVTRAAWARMRAARYGRVVNVTSHSVYGFPNSAAYAVARSGHIGLTTTLAAEGASDDIKVNCVMPAAFTRMTAMLPEGDLRDFIARVFHVDASSTLAVLLAHEEAPCTGQIFHAGGRLFARIALALGSGHVSIANTPEDLLAQFAAVGSVDQLAVPDLGDDVIAKVIARIAETDPSALASAPTEPQHHGEA